MKSFDPEIFETKYKIAEAAVKQYEEHGDDFTLKQVAKEADIEVADIFEYFPNKRAILLFFYESLIIRYRLMLEEIDGFEDYLLAEKLSNLAYTSFDMLGEQEAFVRHTFKRLVLCSFAKTEFEKGIEQLLKAFFTDDPRISASSSMFINDYFYRVLVKKYLGVLQFWLDDDSEGKEVSMELTDKYTAFLQELMYSTAIDRGLDLARFLLSNNIFTSGIKSIKKLFPEIEIRD